MFVSLRRLSFLVLFMLFVVIVKPGAAQSDTVACTALVNLALSQLAANCSDMDANTACYGYNRVETVSAPAEQQNLLSRPGDRIPLGELKSLHASPANPSLGQWGIALLNFQHEANSTQSETSAHLLLLGDTTLKASTSDTQESWQSFMFRTGFEQPTCDQAPSVLAIQNSASTPVVLSVNNAQLQVTSLVSLQWHSTNNMTATVQSGQLQVVNGPTAQTGETLVGVMDNNGQILFWSSPRAATDKELQISQQVVDAFNRVGGDISIPVATPPIPATASQDTPEPTEACGTSVTHVVEPNETLFRIALRYGTTVDAIVAANNIPNRDQINPGEALTIPCGVDSNNSGATPPATDGQNAANPTPFDCSGGIPAGLPANLQDALVQFCANQHP